MFRTERSAAPSPDVNSMITSGLRLYLSWIPNSTGSLIPNSCESMAPMLVWRTLSFFDFTKNARQVPTLANPYIAQSVITGLNPVFASREVSIIVYV